MHETLEGRNSASSSPQTLEHNSEHGPPLTTNIMVLYADTVLRADGTHSSDFTESATRSNWNPTRGLSSLERVMAFAVSSNSFPDHLHFQYALQAALHRFNMATLYSAKSPPPLQGPS